MRDIELRQLACFGIVQEAINFWEVSKGTDPNERHCCDGNECACGGMTAREYWKILAGYDGKTEEEAQ